MRTVIIPDVHMDCLWVDSILEREWSRMDKLICLGDWFDRPNPRAAALNPFFVTRYLIRLRQKLAAAGKEQVWLIGNHELTHLELTRNINDIALHRPQLYRCSGATMSTAARIHATYRSMGQTWKDFWDAWTWCHVQDGFLISHAGASLLLWGDRMGPLTPQAFTAAVECEAQACLDRFSPLLAAVGRIRGGPASAGGLVWQDWEDEFVDIPGVPQIVGHSYNGWSPGAGDAGDAHPWRKGASWNLDGHQTCYGILEDGKVSLHLA